MKQRTIRMWTDKAILPDNSEDWKNSRPEVCVLDWENMKPIYKSMIPIWDNKIEYKVGTLVTVGGEICIITARN